MDNSINQIAKIVGYAVEYSVELDNVVFCPKKERSKGLLARQVAMYLVRVGFEIGYEKIAVVFNCHYTTVINAVQIIEDLRDHKKFDEYMDRMTEIVQILISIRGQKYDLPA